MSAEGDSSAPSTKWTEVFGAYLHHKDVICKWYGHRPHGLGSISILTVTGNPPLMVMLEYPIHNKE